MGGKRLIACKILQVVVLIGGSALLSACARPTGDFGRSSTKFTITHDWVLPLAGFASATLFRAEMTSRFNYTENEAEMRQRAWALVSPPHHDQWISNIEAEWQRTRILSPLKRHLGKDSYHYRLRRENFISSDARWNRFIEDMISDTNLIDPFYASASRVVHADRSRLAAYRNLQAEQNTRFRDHQNVWGRVQANDDVISWVLVSLDYRYGAYFHTLQRLMVEEPASSQRLENRARRALSSLHAAIAATRGDLDAYDSKGGAQDHERPLVIKG